MTELEYAPELPAASWGRYQRVRADAGDRLVRVVPAEPAAHAMALRHAWQFTRDLDLEQALVPSSIEFGATQVTLVYPDPTVSPMSATPRPDTTLGLIKRALGVVVAVEALHDAGITHRGVRPDAFLLDATGVRVGLFDHASRAAQGLAEIADPAGLHDRLPYIAPEQTGRLNRPLDHRADLYGLGITLYWLFSGQLPFSASDPLGWVHAHLARRPRALATVPLGLAEIPLRLLAKDPEDRYQSAAGVRADLEAAAKALETHGHLDDFEPTAFRQSDRFHLPAGLYGREVELDLLQAGFQASRTAPAFAAVTGDPGIGKSRLIGELLRTVTAEGGYFVEGKADQFRRARPFDALLDAMDDLVRQVAMRPAAEVARLRAALREALGDNAAVIVKSVPAALWLLGKGTPPPRLGPDEAELRFRLTLTAFLEVFADPEQPLVLFLDDLQWVDRPTLDVLRQVLTTDMPPGLYLVGAWRPGEVDEDHPLHGLLAQVKAADVHRDSVHLGPLPLPAVEALVADAVGAKDARSQALARLVVEKTASNPFFVGRFLLSLHEDGLLTHQDGRWQWDPQAIADAALMDNVVELMANRIEGLPAAAREAMEHAAAIGAEANLQTLSEVLGAPPEEVLARLQPCFDSHLLVPVGDMAAAQPESPAPLVLRFAHDRVQEAAYSKLEGGQRAAVHLAIAEVLRRSGARVFDLAHHFARAEGALNTQASRQEAAALQLQAGTAALEAGAHVPARDFLRTGTSMLGTDAWDDQYDLTLALHTHLAVAERASGDPARARTLIDLVSDKAATPLDRAPMTELKIYLYNNDLKLSEAVDETLALLADLGHEIPVPAGEEDVMACLGQVGAAIGDRDLASVADAPELTDPVLQAATRVLGTSLPSAAMARPEMHIPMMAKGLLLTLEHGVAPAATAFFGHYGIIMCAFGQVDLGYASGRLSTALNKRFAATGTTGGFVEFPVFVQHWREPARASAELLRTNTRRSLELGDPTVYGYCLNQLINHEVLTGYPLGEIDARYPKYAQGMIDHHQHLALPPVQLWGQCVSCLRGDAPDPARLTGERFEFESTMAAFEEVGVATSVGFGACAAMIVATVFNDPAYVAHIAERYGQWLAAPVNLPPLFSPVAAWLEALARLRLALEDPAQREAAEAAIARVRQVTAEAPQNHAHRALLLDAELARLDGDLGAAMAAYDAAAAKAAELGFPQDEALALERAAEFHEAEGRGRVAAAYWRSAVEAYDRWGASAKVARLHATHAEVLGGIRQVTSDGLDLNTVLQVNEALAGEIQLDRLLDRLLGVVLENAGAERALLLLDQDGELLVEAEATADSSAVLESVPLEQATLPHDLVRFVTRTREAVVLEDAQRATRFAGTADVKARKLRSVACLPLDHQGKSVGVLYLENNLTAGAFTDARVALLRALSTQAATALTNAILYAEARQTSAELVAKNQALTELDRLRADFLARTSHELRTPIHGIIGIAQSLAEGSTGALEPATVNNLEMIVHSGRRLANLVNDLLDLQSMQRGAMQVKRAPTDLAARARAVFDLSSGLVAFKDVDLQLDLPDDLPLVSADGDRLEQVLFNLVGNAIKFTDEGTVKLTVQRSGDHLTVAVEDTGVGIAAEMRERIFEEFDQGDSQRARDLGGTGIGLAVAKQIVEAHGSVIRVESTLGMGSTFQFDLPVASGAEVLAARTQERRRVVLDAVSVTPAPVAQTGGATVLVVDDEPVNLQVIINQLSRRGYEVVTSMSGEEALDRMEAGLRPDIVLLDVMMPRMDGYTVCQRLRQTHPATELPVVMLTAKAQTADLVEGLAAGANDYVTKPFSSEALLARIRTQLSLSSINRAVARFVPSDFVHLLGHESIAELRAGEFVARDMAVMFANVRAFRDISGEMSAEENFGFINEYLNLVEPAVVAHRGVVDKYIGDAVMALFDGGPADAVRAGLQIADALNPFNLRRAEAGKLPVQIGIGVNNGPVILGAVGTENRLDTTVISDVVSAASRVQGLTKRYASRMLVTQAVLDGLDEEIAAATRLLDEVRWGDGAPTPIIEVYAADPPGIRAAKDATKTMFEQGVRAFHDRSLDEAQRLFNVCTALDPTDAAVRQYIDRLSKIQAYFTGRDL